jgi:hypothetical protein
MAEPASSRRRRALFLLAVGAVLGIACGIVSAFKGSDPHLSSLPDEAIAVVNGTAVTTEDYARAVALLASDKRTAITEADRAYVLARLIDEEVLIQYGIASGLVETDRAVRKAITQAMLAAIVTEHTSELPADDVLHAFYAEHRSLFVRAPAEQDGQITAGGVEQLPPFDDIRAQVEEVYLQRARDEALREYLAWLRSEAEIVLQPDILSSPIEREGQDGTYGQ